MSNADQTAVAPADKFSPFCISTHTYKIVDEHPVLVDVFIPNTLVNSAPGSDTWEAEKHPVIVRIHGGWLIGGQRDFAPWFPAWLLELALQHDAVVVAPDYRLLPEARGGEEILDDLDDFWTWLGRDLPEAVRGTCSGLRVDLDRVLVEGESAGGYLAVQAALTHFKPAQGAAAAPRIRALVAAYPMLGLRAPHWTQDYHKQIFDAPQFSHALIDAHLARVRNAPARPVRSNASMDRTARGALALAVVQRGRLLEVLGADRDAAPGRRRLHPEDRVEDGRALPPTLFIHGTDDSGVPVEGTDRFVALLKKHKAVGSGKEDGEVLRFARVPGDHGFDSDLGLESSEWIKEGVAFVEKHWLD